MLLRLRDLEGGAAAKAFVDRGHRGARPWGGVPPQRGALAELLQSNLYESEAQNVGWHADDEGLFRGTEQDCCIISASWGCPRAFEVALKDTEHSSGRPSIFRSSMKAVVLHPGDVLTMEGLFQKHYSHQVPRGPTAVESDPPQRVRVNLTWRRIVAHKPYCPLAG